MCVFERTDGGGSALLCQTSPPQIRSERAVDEIGKERGVVTAWRSALRVRNPARSDLVEAVQGRRRPKHNSQASTRDSPRQSVPEYTPLRFDANQGFSTDLPSRPWRYSLSTHPCSRAAKTCDNYSSYRVGDPRAASPRGCLLPFLPPFRQTLTTHY